MDVSIVAAVGSFIVSEKVIKAKTLVLFGLLCTVTYDLFIHSNDPVSLRVYRGEQGTDLPMRDHTSALHRVY